ncbi:MAG TPA: very short patch repair endonuclease [Pyrinomonadaceae bacterium]|nr:very short patch repair endonuclease [Pyrinomonadaceae bacterium]
MPDVLTPEQRRYNMSLIRNRNTRPEMIVRSMVHRMGYRYSLHRKELPGKPDLVFTRRRKIIFVHGCFFHMHDCPYGRVTPKTNAEFWQTKRLSNVERDKRNRVALEQQGWKIFEVWECMTKPARIEKLPEILADFLE